MQMISCNLIILHFLKNPIFLSRKKNSITWRHQSMCAIFGGVALRICCVDSLHCTGIVLLILLANSTSNTIFLRKIVKGLRITCCFKQSEYVLHIDRFGHFPSKSKLLILAECLPLCIYEVGWVHCALASRNKVPRVKFLIVYWGLWRKFKTTLVVILARAAHRDCGTRW